MSKEIKEKLEKFGRKWKFIKIEPGNSTELLKDGDSFSKVKDFKTIEDMVGEIIFMITDDEKTNEN